MVNVADQYALTDVMIVHLDVLSPGMKHRILCELDAAQIIAVDQYWLVHQFVEVFQQSFKPYSFTSSYNCGPILRLSAR